MLHSSFYTFYCTIIIGSAECVTTLGNCMFAKLTLSPYLPTKTEIISNIPVYAHIYVSVCLCVYLFSIVSTKYMLLSQNLDIITMKMNSLVQILITHYDC